MDIIIPLGNGSRWDNNELRYCLRSIEKFATGYNRIFIIGECPEFLQKETKEAKDSETSLSSLPSVKFFPLKEITANKEARIAHKIFWAFQHTDIADTAVLFNDDYVLNLSGTQESMNFKDGTEGSWSPGFPIDLSSIPYFHRESLLDAANRHPDEGYWNGLKFTHKLLSEAGKPTWHYDIHVPMILRRQEFLGLEKWWQKSLYSAVGLVVKSTYANNVLDSPGPQIHDLKLLGPCRNLDALLKDRWVFSYCDSGLTPELKAWLAAKFPEPSKWEIGDSRSEIGFPRHLPSSISHPPCVLA